MNNPFPAHKRLTPEAIQRFKVLRFVLQRIYSRLDADTIMEKFIHNYCEDKDQDPMFIIAEDDLYDVNYFVWGETDEGTSYWQKINGEIRLYHKSILRDLGLHENLGRVNRRPLNQYINALYKKSLLPVHIEIDDLD